ncbi:MAG: MBL fold metallo-hydrolase [Eggerthellaceae bacterium]|jgi:glyoxylase-like metal-dependent hydrolase (beta-lactamase superfamily II)|nr:MBL fold metallo-hydrolase [Eggerthellaceae bacterium]MDR2722017.1 MBL fold metallo-hydrolase [Coriobacteriaceae bacterium]
MSASLKNDTPSLAWKGGRLSPFTRCVLADNPSALTYAGTNTWILSRTDSSKAILVDPGPESKKHFEAIARVCKEDGLNIEAILLTHSHLDHSEGAAELAKYLAVSVFSRKDATLKDGLFQLNDESVVVEVISLPGHCADSIGICFGLDRSIVTGDVIFAQSPTIIALPDGNLRDYFESLRYLKELVKEGFYTSLLSGHGVPIEDPLSCISKTEAHRFKRLAQLRGAINRGNTIDIDYLLEIIYIDIDACLKKAAKTNLQAQLEYLFAIQDPCVSGFREP